MAPWPLKPDPMIEQREREERERERLRREREERERREREEKRRIEQQVSYQRQHMVQFAAFTPLPAWNNGTKSSCVVLQQAEQRERERREKERRELEQREREQRERERERERERDRERERLLHQQRLADAAKPMQSVIRDRSPLRNGDVSDMRIKEEPRSKEEETVQLLRSAAAVDPRYHPYLRHAPPHQQLQLSRVLPPPGSLQHHYAPPPSHWPPPTDAFFRYDAALRYGTNPLMDAAFRAEEERVKMFQYAHAASQHPSQLRAKDPTLMHLRPGPGPGGPGPPPPHKLSITPPTDLHKKEEPR